MHRAIAEALSAHPDCPCLLLVHPDVRVLQENAETLAVEEGWQRLSVGKELSALLLNESPQSRARLARSWLGNSVAPLSPGPVVVTDIDLLFEPSWRLDPLGLFRLASRTTRLVVAWPGTFESNILAYAVPEHSAYRTWSGPGVQIACLA